MQGTVSLEWDLDDGGSVSLEVMQPAQDGGPTRYEMFDPQPNAPTEL